MQIYLRGWFYYLIWFLGPKKICNIDGNEITYMQLPWWMLIGGRDSKRRFVDGMRIVRMPSFLVMIFVSDRECKSRTKRYTIYHEFIEAQYVVHKTYHDPNTLSKLLSFFEKAVNHVSEDIPEIRAILSRAYKDGGELSHLYALALELYLAKKEMSLRSYHRHIDEALQCRL